MSSVTELTLFKAAVNKPITLSSIADLTLDQVPAPMDAESLNAKEVAAKKALKVFHMVWSGVTKYIKTAT
jgi:hypothetical protein